MRRRRGGRAAGPRRAAARGGPRSGSASRVVVAGFDELVARPLRDGVNAVCWPRALAGDFAEVARLLAPPDGFVDVDAATLRALALSDAGRAAADAMLDD